MEGDSRVKAKNKQTSGFPKVSRFSPSPSWNIDTSPPSNSKKLPSTLTKSPKLVPFGFYYLNRTSTKGGGSRNPCPAIPPRAWSLRGSPKPEPEPPRSGGETIPCTRRGWVTPAVSAAGRSLPPAGPSATCVLTVLTSGLQSCARTSACLTLWRTLPLPAWQPVPGTSPAPVSCQLHIVRPSLSLPSLSPTLISLLPSSCGSGPLDPLLPSWGVWAEETRGAGPISGLSVCLPASPSLQRFRQCPQDSRALSPPLNSAFLLSG